LLYGARFPIDKGAIVVRASAGEAKQVLDMHSSLVQNSLQDCLFPLLSGVSSAHPRSRRCNFLLKKKTALTPSFNISNSSRLQLGRQ
jgi:hypothetical protein